MRRELGWLVLVLGMAAVSMAWVRHAEERPISTAVSAPPSPVPTPSRSAIGRAPSGCLPRAWLAQSRQGTPPGHAVFRSVFSGYAVVALDLGEDGRYTLHYSTDVGGSGKVLRHGTFTLREHYLTLADGSKAPLVLRVAHDEKGPLLYVDTGDLGTTDPYVVMPLSFDGRVKEQSPPPH